MTLKTLGVRAREAQEAGVEPKGFIPLSLKRFHKENGTVVVPNEEGYFAPQDQEELDILMHHLEAGRVEFYTGLPQEEQKPAE